MQNLADCIDAITGTTTTTTSTTIPTDPDTTDPDTTDPDTSDPDTSDPDTTDPDTTDPTGIPTTSEEDDFCEGLILEEGDICDGPLTDDEGNDFFEWDEYDEDVYLTDGSYKVQYLYTEDSMKLAATCIILSNMVISSILILLSGIFFFTKTRKRKLLSEIRTVDSKDLDSVYKNLYKLKKQIEKTFKEEVRVNINLDLINPYGVVQDQVSDRIKNINNIAAELDYTKVAVINLVKQFNDLEEKLTKEILLERLELISSGMFEIIFTGQKITTPIEDSYVKVKKLSKKRVRKPKTYTAKYTRLSLGFSSILIIAGLGIGIYAMQQVYFTDIQYQASQQALEQVYTADDDVKISRTQQPKINERLLSIFNDVPVFESLSDTLLDNIYANAVDYSPDVFGQLEIASINLSQFIVSGTDEQSLEFGPGHYMQTALPGNGGNVGIAGHRTTFGAPFAKLDQVQIGDELILTVDSKKFHYVVDEVRIVEAIGGEYVLYNRGDDRLTLTTCHPRYSARQRLVVTGILTRIESVN